MPQRRRRLKADEITIRDICPTPRELWLEAEALVYLAEGDARGAAYFKREDIGWIGLGTTDTRDLSRGNRIRAVKLSRTYGKLDALCSQVIRIYTAYAIGTGITFTSKDKEASELIKAFTTSPANRRYFRAQGQREISMQLLQDGERFWTVFENGTAPAESKLRHIDVLQITDILTDPQDELTPWYYRREFYKGRKKEVKYYRDYMYEGNEPAEDFNGKDVTPEVEPDVVICHTRLDSTGMRGVPILTPSLDEAKANREFTRARLAIVLSLAQFIWKLKMKGGQKAVDAARTEFNSTLGSEGTETKPPATSGSTWAENEGVDRQPIKQETGASAAKVDGEQLVGRFGSGTGVFSHYLGYGDAYKLATATAMELPMLKITEGYQGIHCDMYKELLGVPLRAAGLDDQQIVAKAPAILQKEIGKRVHAIVEGASVYPRALDSPDVEKELLSLFGVHDVERVHGEIEKAPVGESHVETRLVQIVKEIRKLGKLAAEGKVKI